MAFAQDPSELEKALVGRNFEEEISSTCEMFNGDLSGIPAATELTRERSSMFEKKGANELLQDEHAIIVMGNMTGGPWSTHDLFDKNGIASVHTLAFYVHGGQIDSLGNHVLKFCMHVLKRPNATAAAPTPGQQAAAAFHHPETIQTKLGRVLVVNPRTLYGKTSDPTVRQKYEETVTALKAYMSAVTSPKLKKMRTEELLESKKGGGAPKGLFAGAESMPEYYDRKNGVSVSSIMSKSIVATHLEDTSFSFRMGGPQSRAFLPDRTPNFERFIRQINLTAQQMTDVMGQHLAMDAIAVAAAGARAAKDPTQVSLFDQTRKWSFLQRIIPGVFAIDELTGDPKSLIDFLFKGQFGKPIILDDFGKVKRHEISVGAQHEEKLALDMTLLNHQALLYAGYGGPWKTAWEPTRELINSGKLQGNKLRASYVLSKLNEAVAGWSDKIHTCGFDDIPGYDFRVVSDVFKLFQESMETATLSMTAEDQLGFMDNIQAGVHPNDLVFGKRQGGVPVVTPDKGRKRKDDTPDKKLRTKKEKRKEAEHEDEPRKNRTDDKVCDYHLLHLLGIKNDESFKNEAKRGKLMACDFGDNCKHPHPVSITKSAALRVLKECHPKSILFRFKKQALEAAGELLG